MGSLNTILQANNITRIQKGEYDAAATMQKSANKREAMNIALKEFSRTLGNNLRIEAAGKQFNETMGQLAQQSTAASVNHLNLDLAASQRLGQLNTQAAAAGIGGTSVDLLNDTITLQRLSQATLDGRSTELGLAAGQRSASNIMNNAYMSQDLAQSFGTFDYTRHIPPQRMKRRLGKLIGVAVATYFGGPMAGQAVADFAVGEWQASNAKFDAAGQSYSQGVQNAISGYKTWSSLQDNNPNTQDNWFGAVRQSIFGAKGSSVGGVQPETVQFQGATDYGADFDWFISQ